MTSDRAKWLPLGAIAATAAIMMWWTWGTWPDVLVDFGWEVYAAWRLLEGKLLYRDLAWLSGPLSPYLNAALFKCFGVGIRTLVFSNLFLVAVLVALIWNVIAVIGSRLGATISALVFLTLFAFSQFAAIGNYNFVTPYTYGITHGVVLSFVAMACFSSFLHSTRSITIAIAGLAVGLTILTKAEVSLACGAALGVGLAGTLWIGLIPPDRRVRAIACFCGGILFPLAATFLMFLKKEQLSNAAIDTFGAWRFVVTSSLSSEGFFQRLAGFDDPGTSVRSLLASAAVYLMVFGAAGWAALRVRRHPSRDLFAIPFVVALGAFSWSTRVVPWHRVAQPFSLIMLLLLGIFGFQFLRRPPSELAAARRIVMQLTLVTFAFALLLKIALNPILFHYGFALAMPAMLVLAVTLVDWIPSALSRRGGAGVVFQAIGLAALTTLVATHLVTMAALLRQKTEIVGTGPDRFLADSRGRAIRGALSDIAIRLRPDETLAVFPEGVMLNYLSRRSNPTRFISFIPQSLRLFGESNVVAALDLNRPDYVALVHHDTTDMGGQFFGRDYGQGLMAWLRAHYKEVEIFGARPYIGDQFGILLMERNTSK